MQVLLVGNPNCGKTTLFNALTGANQKVGNWPGVTVEKKSGFLKCSKKTIEIIDLPGVYSLALSKQSSLDEQIAATTISLTQADLIINVINACHLERHLYLSSQLLESGKPMILVLNMMDLAKEAGISIDLALLSRQTGCPVIPLQAHKKIGLDLLKAQLEKPFSQPESLSLDFSMKIQRLLDKLDSYLVGETGLSEKQARFFSLRAFEGDQFLLQEKAARAMSLLIGNEKDYDIIFATERYEKLHELVLSVQKKRADASEHFTAKIDRIVLHRYLGLPLFFTIMYLMFLIAINLGGAFQDFFDLFTEAVFVKGAAIGLLKLHAPAWVIALIANGIGRGINTTLTFIPVIASMYFCLAILESSGYMARAAFVVDKLMRLLGLPGKSFVPMIVGFGCNVPAIMAARTLDSDRDRLLTVLMAPFMSCSARLAIFAVFVAAFFPVGGQNIVFLLYLTGILMAVFTGFILRKTSLRGKSSPLVLDLPAYHKPSLQRLLRETHQRLRYFILRAGRLIIPICILLGGLNVLTVKGTIVSGEASVDSVLSLFGQWLTPVFSPMGIQPDNWPATVGLLTGTLAKEVVVGSLNALYMQAAHLSILQQGVFDFWAAIKASFMTIPENLSHLTQALTNPVQASAPDSTLSQPVYGEMVSRFDGKAGAFAYLLFILLYIPCISTMAAIKQEASKRFMGFSVLWSFILAYTCAVSFYQMARFFEHPLSSLFWIGCMACLLLGFLVCLRHSGSYLEIKNACTNS